MSKMGGWGKTAFFELAFERGAIGLGSAAAEILYVVTGHSAIVAHTSTTRWPGPDTTAPGLNCFDFWSLARSGGGHTSALLEAFAAEDRPALCGAERDSSFLAALRAGGAGLDFSIVEMLSRWSRGPENGDAFGLACLATLGFVLELLVVKEKLFAGGEDEFCAAVNTLQHLVLKFH
jgi:hypothetical protein